ncbi:putative RNA polymerase II transcriptional coactivator [Calycina marina]|uniref:RNA polymerase II transcriptional coactivator n=1 Tax=Calycina marina TaxID=1763456 RepID=A0A9P7Z314_9HELO|nr:putative RNA polymerase II transcriptional coactivator [Calycina marina]
MSKFKRSRDVEDDEGGFIDDSDDAAPKSKKTKETVKKENTKAASQDSAENFWSLSTGRTPRRVNISDFKNMKMINIREYYEKDEEYLPGKKGISLTIDQYKTLLKSIPEINKSLAAQGIRVDEADDEEDSEPPKKAVAKLKKESKAKANIESTSDEEEG